MSLKRGEAAWPQAPGSGKRLKADQDSRQILQLSTLVTLLRPEMVVVGVQLLQLQLLLLVTAGTKTRLFNDLKHNLGNFGWS